MTLDRSKLPEGLKEYGSGAREDSTLLWTSANTFNKNEKQVADPNATAKSNINFVNGMHPTVRRNGQTVTSSHMASGMQGKIWRGVDANTFFNNSPQKAVEAMLNLRGGDNLIMFDMETLGTFKPDTKRGDALNWYTPTEIAMVHSRYNADGTVSVAEHANARLSLLVKPTDDVFKSIRGILDQVKTSQGKVWQNLSRDQRRSLSDLTLYAADDPTSIFKTENGVTYVTGQTRHLMPLEGSILSDPKTIGRMERGLDNLMDHGNDMGTIAVQVNNYMNNIRANFGGTAKIGGYNIHAFDMPVFMDYINQGIAKSNPGGHIHKALSTLHSNIANTDHVDVYSAINSLYTDSLDRFGMNKKLESLGQKFGVKKMMGDKYGGKSHFALYDAEATAHVFNSLLTGKDMRSDMYTYINNLRSGKYAGWNMSGVDVGDTFFAHTGLRGSEENPHDAVYRLTQKGKFELAYDIRNGGRAPSIYKNATYKVFGMYDNMILSDGKKYNGMMLHNEDDGLYHFIARDNMSDLQNAFHRSFSFLGDNPMDAKAHEFTNMDRAMRHYSRMYSDEGGVNLINRTYAGLDAMNKYLGGRDISSLSDDEMKKLASTVRSAGKYNFKGEDHYATPEFFRNLKYLAPRLEAERQFVMPFVNRLQIDPSFKTGQGKVDREAQGIALRQFRNILNDRFGENKAEVEVGGNGAVAVQIDGKDKYLTLNSREALKGQLRGAVTDGFLGHPGNYMVKSRLLSLINQLKAEGGGRDAKRGISNTELDRIKNSIDSLGDKESYNGIIDYLGNVLYDIRKMHGNMGISKINIEDPTQLIQGRKTAMEAAMKAGEFGHLYDRAIENALPFRGYGFKNGTFNINGNSSLADIFRSHDNAVKRIMGKSRVTGSSIGAPIKAADKLSDLASAFTYNNMEVALMYHGEKKGLVMAIANKADAERIFKLSPNEILQGQNKVALINLGMVNRDGSMTLPNQERIARLALTNDSKGGYRFATGFDEIVDAVKMSSRKLSEMVAGGDAIGAQSWASGIVRRTVEGLSMNNRRMNHEDADMFRADVSGAAKWARGGIIDVHVLADEWFRTKFSDNKGQARYKEIKERASRNRTSFVDSLHMDDRMQFHREVEGFASSKGLHLDAGSVKDTHVSQYLRGTRDIRELTPFGYYNPMARENILKSVNYLPLEKEAVRKSLEVSIRKSNPQMDNLQVQAEVERRMTRRFITNTAGAELADEAKDSVNYLNLRAAYMNDKQLSDLMRSKGINNSRLSTYDGMFLMADDIADALTHTREKAIRFEAGTKLHSQIEDLFGPGFDYKTSVTLKDYKNGKTLMQLGLTKDIANGHVSVGTLAREEIKNGKTVTKTKHAYYEDVQDDVRVKGWDAERQALILEKNEMFLDGFKGITDAGDRVSVVRVKREELRQMGIDADVVLDPMKASRRQFGSEPYKAVSLVLDEAMRQAGGTKFTAGDMNGREVSDVVRDMMVNNFTDPDGKYEIGNYLHAKDGNLVLDSRFGLDGQKIGIDQIHGFLNEADTKLGTNFANGSIVYGNVGFGVANVYNWQNSIGVVSDDHEGLVRWGIKERDIIKSRVSRVLGGDSEVGRWVDTHISAAAKSQNHNIQQHVRGLWKAVDTYAEGKDQSVSATDIIIKTRDEGFDTEHFVDQKGRNTARRGANGGLEISMHALNDLPTKAAQNQRFTVGDYQNTIISMRDLEINKIMENGQLKDYSKDEFQSFLKGQAGADGSVLFELPDNTFTHNHVRFASTDINPNLSTVATDKLQKAQMDIWRKTKEYMKEGNQDNHDKLQGSIDQYHETVAHTLSSARDGSISKRLLSAKMNMAGRFSIQSINPFEAAKARGGKGYEESTAYVSRDRMLEMISDSDKNGKRIVNDGVAKAMGVDVAKYTVGDHVQHELFNNKVLDEIQNKGLYGFVGRYPTINEDTIQVMKVQIDSTMKNTNREARLNAATALRLKADFDGDFLSTVLSHYGDANSGKIHQEMGKIWTEDKSSMNEFADQLHADMVDESQKKGITPGQLWKDPKFREEYGATWLARTSTLDNRETLEARLGKSYIGMVDNMRFKMSNIANRTYDMLAENGFVETGEAAERKATIAEFGRMFSQELISSKKFDVNDIRKKLGEGATDEAVTNVLNKRIDSLHAITNALQTPNADNIATIKKLAPELVDKAMDKMTINANGGYKSISMDYALETVNKTWAYNSSQHRWLSTNSANMFISEGRSIDQLVDLKNGAEPIVATTGLDELAEADPDNFGAAYAVKSQKHTDQVLMNARMMQNDGSGMDSYWRDSGESASLGRSMFDAASNKSSGSIGSFERLANGMMSGMGDGKFSFGAVQAGLATFGGLWAASAAMRSGPTPEETVRSEDGTIQNVPIKNMMSQPTARVTPNQNGEQINIAISAKHATQMNHDQIASLVQGELGAMMPMQLNMNMNVNDNSQNINKQWLQGVVAQAMNTGRVF